MKCNILLLLLFYLTVACSKKEDFKSIDEFVTSTNPFKSSRNLAQSTGDVCFDNKVTESKILREIKELENNRVTGPKYILNGMDLSKFSASEAIFIDKNKEWIQTTGIDAASCTDVKCLFSQIYPNSNGLEGYIHYYFYLKMGYALNTVKDAPFINLSEKVTFKDLLFSHEELQHFYYLAKLVGPSLQKLPTLLSIHRLMRHTNVPSYDEDTCGIAGGYLSKGYVLLMDKCLSINKDSVLTGSFVPLATHEIAHRLDYHLDKNRVSHSKEWLDLSGWEIRENTDQATGKVVTSWKKKSASDSSEKYDGFYRDYASTQPGEDFADAIGHFRSYPAQMKTVSPRKFKWITDNVYQGKDYTPEGLGEAYYDYLLSFGMSNLPVVVERCLANKTSFNFNNDPSLITSFAGYDQGLIQCIFGGVDDYLSQGVRNLKENEVEACDYFSTSDKLLRGRVFQGLVSFVKSDLNKNIEIQTQLLHLSELMSKIIEEIDPREIFITCQEETKPKGCYQETLTGKLQEISSDFVDRIPNQIKSLETTYLKDNSYEFVNTKIVELFSQIFLGSELSFKKEAERKWNLCKDAPATLEDPLLLTPFSGDSQFMSSGIINCINTNAESELVEILNKSSKKLGISIASDSIKKFVLNMYLSNYTSALVDNAKNVALSEKKQVETLQKAINSSVQTKLTQDMSWINSNATSNDTVREQCREHARSIIKNELETSHKANFEQLRFHSMSDFMVEDGICASVSSSSRLNNLLQDNKDRAFNETLKDLDEFILKHSESHITACRKQFTRKDSTAARNRKNCLVKKWKTITDKAIQDWGVTNEYSSSQRRPGYNYLEKNKTKLQNNVAKEMEAR